jgi:hypothetical protein
LDEAEEEEEEEEEEEIEGTRPSRVTRTQDKSPSVIT